MQILKQAVGVDVSKDNLVVCFGTLSIDLKQNFSSIKTYDNNQKGFKALLKWVTGFAKEESSVWFVMEATGVYYENLAYFLSENQYQLTVLLPNKAKNYIKTLDNKSKTDGLDALALAAFGLEKTLKQWQIPDKLFKILKELTREHLTIKGLKNQVSNRLHAKNHSYKPTAETIKRLKQQLSMFSKQLKEIKQEIEQLVKQNTELFDKISKIQKIKGVGLMTIVTILSETNGFVLIENSKQLTSYAGIDVVHNQSGYSVGKTRISKKGNSFIRHCLFMPALSAAKHDQRLNKLYVRLVSRKNAKKIAVVAVMRKLLVLIYTLWKKNIEFVPDYKLS